MYIPRIIPILLLRGKGLVKTLKFSDPTYIGDPINAVRIFNDLKADELVYLDISATKEHRQIDLEIVKDIAGEAFMPFAIGGGISDILTVEKILNLGCEKVVINSSFYGNTNLIPQIVSNFGSQSLVLSIDVKKNFWGNYEIFSHSGSKKQKHVLNDVVSRANDLGVGEIIINSIDNDGQMTGYDLKLIKSVTSIAKCPTVACGGAGSMKDFLLATEVGGAHAVAAGSMFVYHGPRKAVLINYPSKEQIKDVFKNKEINVGI